MEEAEKRAVMGCWVLVLGGGARRGREDGDRVTTVIRDVEKRGKWTADWFYGGGKRTRERPKKRAR